MCLCKHPRSTAFYLAQKFDGIRQSPHREKRLKEPIRLHPISMSPERSAGKISLLIVGIYAGGRCEWRARGAGQAQHIRSDGRICEKYSELHRSNLAPDVETTRAIAVQKGATSVHRNANRMMPKKSPPSIAAPVANN